MYIGEMTLLSFIRETLLCNKVFFLFVLEKCRRMQRSPRIAEYITGMLEVITYKIDIEGYHTAVVVTLFPTLN